MSEEEAMGAAGAISPIAAFALEVTDSVLWALNIDTGETRMVQGPAEDLFKQKAPRGGVEVFFKETVHPDDLMELQELYIDVVEGNTEEFKVIFRTHPKNGEISWIDSHARVRMEDGERILTGISTDITELKRHEQELATQNQRLEELTHILSHDLRNPLNVAAGRIRLAMETGDLTHLEGADLALSRMESLINDLLTLSRSAQATPDAQVDPAQLEPVELAETATGCWQNVATNGADLTVETELAVRAHSSKLKQLFENLFRNAIEHAGPTVTVTVGELDDRSGFYVADDGPGIPGEIREEIFEHGYSTTDTGFGLGLHIAQTIVDAHGWEITVTDAEPQGARFEITNIVPV